MDVEIRHAEVADAESAAACHVACWREAYADIADPVTLDRRAGDMPTRVERWRSFARNGPPRWVAVEDGEVVGFSAASPGRDEDLRASDPDLVELQAIYVRARAYGSGLGDRLLAAAIGDAPAYLWVLEDNARARAFYTRHGFGPDGGRKHDDAFGAWEVRLRR